MSNEIIPDNLDARFTYLAQEIGETNPDTAEILFQCVGMDQVAREFPGARQQSSVAGGANLEGKIAISPHTNILNIEDKPVLEIFFSIPIGKVVDSWQEVMTRYQIVLENLNGSGNKNRQLEIISRDIELVKTDQYFNEMKVIPVWDENNNFTGITIKVDDLEIDFKNMLIPLDFLPQITEEITIAEYTELFLEKFRETTPLDLNPDLELSKAYRLLNMYAKSFLQIKQEALAKYILEKSEITEILQTKNTLPKSSLEYISTLLKELKINNRESFGLAKDKVITPNTLSNEQVSFLSFINQQEIDVYDLLLRLGALAGDPESAKYSADLSAISVSLNGTTRLQTESVPPIKSQDMKSMINNLQRLIVQKNAKQLNSSTILDELTQMRESNMEGVTNSVIQSTEGAVSTQLIIRGRLEEGQAYLDIAFICAEAESKGKPTDPLKVAYDENNLNSGLVYNQSSASY